MSRKEDVLFCKIAISNGLITEQAANKALQFCERRERETGRRPLIGAIFQKHNLMQNDEVRRIYTAVEKRLGTPVGPVLSPARGARGRGKGRRGARPAGPRGRKAKATRPVDPRTLWMGIGGLVVFVIIMVVICVLILLPSGGDEDGGDRTVLEGDSISGTVSGSGGAAGKRKAGGSSSGVSPPAVKTVETDKATKAQLDPLIYDARSGTTNPEMYLERLKTERQKLADKGYEPYQRLEDAIADLEKQIAEEGGSSEPQPGAEETTSAEPEPAAEEPAGEPAKESAEEEDLEKLLEGL